MNRGINCCACVELVRQSGDDRALRSELVQMIVGRVAAELLPLSSAEAVRVYQLVVATAAWIADGVPEAEDFVRAYRMWASNADQPVFVGGNWQWRAFFGLITLFIALPLLNSSMAKPAWQVLLAGPSLAENGKRKGAFAAQNRAWFLVTLNAYIEPVHEKCKLPWQQRPGQWPVLRMIEAWQASPSRKRGLCLQRPTCSVYGHRAISEYGLIRGGVMTAWRVFTCNGCMRRRAA